MRFSAVSELGWGCAAAQPVERQLGLPVKSQRCLILEVEPRSENKALPRDFKIYERQKG